MNSSFNSSLRERKKRRDDFPSDFVCPECGGTETIRDRTKGELVCTTCGLVVTDGIIDTGPEWRAFTEEERSSRARTGAPSTYLRHDKGLSTRIGWQNKDAKGRGISSKRRAQIYRLRKWQIRSRLHDSLDRNLMQATLELDRLASQIGLQRSIKELAAMLYRKLITKKLVRSRSIDALVAGSVYAACRLRKIPRSLDEISDYSRISRKKIGRYYRLLVRKLNLRMPISDPMTYVPKMISALGLPGVVQEKVVEILQKVKNTHSLITGRDPRGLVAASIYIASIRLGTNEETL